MHYVNEITNIKAQMCTMASQGGKNPGVCMGKINMTANRGLPANSHIDSWVICVTETVVDTQHFRHGQ